MRWLVAIFSWAILVGTASGQELPRGQGTPYDFRVDRWLDGTYIKDSCVNPDYRVLVPSILNPVVKLIFQLPNLLLEEAEMDLRVEFEFPVSWAAALSDGCDRGWKDQPVAEALRDAAINSAVEGAFGTLTNQLREYLPSSIEIKPNYSRLSDLPGSLAEKIGEGRDWNIQIKIRF